MDQRFSSLFRASKFAALHPKQVLYSPSSHRYNGEWGIKHSLFPTSTPYYHVNTMDDVDGMPNIRSAIHNVARIEIWKEAMPKSTTAFPIPTAKEMMNPPLDQMSGKQFKKLKKKALKQRQKFLTLVNEGTLTREKWTEFFNVRLPMANQRLIHPPVYTTSSLEEKNVAHLKARLLNSNGSGVSVGIGGWVAHVSSVPRMIDRTELKDVYITNATIEENGMPVINASFFKPPSKLKQEKKVQPKLLLDMPDFSARKPKKNEFDPILRRQPVVSGDYESIRDRFRKFSSQL
jgi:hypothetical protein